MPLRWLFFGSWHCKQQWWIVVKWRNSKWRNDTYYFSYANNQVVKLDRRNQELISLTDAAAAAATEYIGVTGAQTFAANPAVPWPFRRDVPVTMNDNRSQFRRPPPLE